MRLISLALLARCFLARGEDYQVNASEIAVDKRFVIRPELFDDMVLSKKKFIEENVKVKPDQAPFRDVFRKEEMPCLSDLGFGVFSGCVTAEFRDRYTMNANTAIVSAFYNVFIEAEASAATEPVYISISRSHSMTSSLSAGWSFGIQSTVNPLGFLGGSASSELNVQATISDTYVREASYTFICPAWHDCQVQTWTWHLTLSGLCEKEPIIRCRSDIRPCLQEFKCPEYGEFAREACQNKTLEFCSVTTALFQPQGAPYSEVKFREFDTRPHFQSCFGPYAILNSAEAYNRENNSYNVGKGWFSKPSGLPPPVLPSPYPCSSEDHVPQVIGRTKKWCQLDDGELYAAETDEYFDTVKGKWYTRPGALKPHVGDFGPCLKNDG